MDGGLNEKAFLKIAAGVMRDIEPMPITIPVQSAWLLISGLQLATRHPDMGEEIRQQLTFIARQFQAAVVERHPEAAQH